MKRKNRKYINDQQQTDIEAEMTDTEAANVFVASIKSLYDSRDYSDFVITCGDRLYRMHKSIVCPRSAVFAAMLRSPLKEGQNNLIDLSEDDVLAVHCMIRYFYFLDYDVDNQMEDSGFENQGTSASATPAESEAGPSHDESINLLPKQPSDHHLKPHHAMKLHAEVYVLADRYDVNGLKRLALGKFAAAWHSRWNADAFVIAAKTAYDWTLDADVKLRESAVEGLFRNQRELLNDARWKAELQSMGHLMYDLARRNSKNSCRVCYNNY